MSSAAGTGSGGRGQRGRGLLAAPAGGVLAPPLDPAAGGDGGQPALRVGQDPIGGPQRRRQQGLLDRVLAGAEVAVASDEGAEDLRGQLPEPSISAGVVTSQPAELQDGPDLDEAELGLRQPGGDLDRPFGALAVEQEEAGQQFLGLGERAVADERPALADRDAPGQRRVGEGLGDDQLAGRGQLVGEGVVVAEALGLLVVAEPLPDLPRHRVAVDQDQVLHWPPPHVPKKFCPGMSSGARRLRPPSETTPPRAPHGRSMACPGPPASPASRRSASPSPTRTGPSSSTSASSASRPAATSPSATAAGSRSPPGAATTIALVPAGIPTGIRLTTKDADTDHAGLRARGVDTDPEVMRIPSAPAMFAVRDPDGNSLILVEGE